MKAIRISEFGGPEVLQYVDVQDPTADKGQVVVQVASISVNYADLVLRSGNYPVMPELPTILGLEAAGIVVEVGEGVSEVAPGQRVAFITPGSYAEKVAVKADLLIPLPANVDFDAATTLVTYLTAYHLLHTQGRAKEGDWALIYAAAGGVGIASIQLAKMAGLKVIGLTSSEVKAQRANDQGADHVLMYDHPNLVQEVLKITGGRGVNLILDSVAGESFARNFEMAAPLGQILWFGMASGPPHEFLGTWAEHFVRGIGVHSFHLTYSIAEPYPVLLGASIMTILDHLQEGRIKPVIYERIPLSEARRAHELVQSRTTVGKVVLKP